MRRGSLIAAIIGLMSLPLAAQAEREFQKPYFMKQEPTISGVVEAVTEHSLTVATQGGEHMTFQVDSHTLMPATLTPETKVWLEYAMMENGDHRAIRVSPLGTGTLEPYQGERPRAEMEERGVENGPATGTVEEMPASNSGDQLAADVDRKDRDRIEDANEAARERAEENAEREKELPRTASPWPLLEALGTMALVTGSVLWFARRRGRSA